MTWSYRHVIFQKNWMRTRKVVFLIIIKVIIRLPILSKGVFDGVCCHLMDTLRVKGGAMRS